MSSSRKSRQELIGELNDALRETSGLGVLYSQMVAAKLMINSTDLECLGYIQARGAVTAGTLAQVTGLTTGAITGVIDRLEQAGLARRERDATDRRKILVRVLPAVAQRIEPLFEPMERAARAALASYRAEELIFLLDFLKSMNAAGLAAMAELRTRGASGPARPATRTS